MKHDLPSIPSIQALIICASFKGFSPVLPTTQPVHSCGFKEGVGAGPALPADGMGGLVERCDLRSSGSGLAGGVEAVDREALPSRRSRVTSHGGRKSMVCLDGATSLEWLCGPWKESKR